jgi:hypothetical protein
LVTTSGVVRDKSAPAPDAPGPVAQPGEASSLPPKSPPTAVASGPAPDPYDPRRFRLDQRPTSSSVRKRHPTIPVRKPANTWFVQCHPSEDYRLDTHVIELKEDRETYLVEPDLWDLLADEATFSPRRLVLTVTRSTTPFLWPIRRPGPDGRIDSWNESALEAAKMAEGSWVRVSANMQRGL